MTTMQDNADRIAAKWRTFEGKWSTPRPAQRASVRSYVDVLMHQELDDAQLDILADLVTAKLNGTAA